MNMHNHIVTKHKSPANTVAPSLVTNHWSQITKIHFIGCIGPFNQFCITQLLEQGKKITASEYSLDQKARQKWEDLGILYKGQQDEANITKDLDLVIIPTGIVPNNPEMRKQRVKNPNSYNSSTYRNTKPKLQNNSNCRHTRQNNYDFTYYLDASQTR